MSENATLKKFREQTEVTKQFFTKMKICLAKGRSMGIAIDDAVFQKIEAVEKQLCENLKLKVALIGGFSEGKTSIAAAWLGKIDKKTMNISQSESSNAVVAYEYSSDLVIYDTPGLFGYKGCKDEKGYFDAFRDRTKKYISEANIILYVMDPSNPVKASHEPMLKWLFKELNLLPRTVFVLNKLDQVADLYSEEDYKENLEIKRKNVIGRLADILTLSAAEQQSLQIVGISVAPNNKGTEHWLDPKYYDEFRKLSRIESLQAATRNVISYNGGYGDIISATQKSVIRDVLQSVRFGVLERLQEDKEEEGRKYAQLHDEIECTKAMILTRKNEFIDWLNSYFRSLILELHSKDCNSLNNFVRTKVGQEGEIVRQDVENRWSLMTNDVDCKIEIMGDKFDLLGKNCSDDVSNFVKKGISVIENSKLTSANSIYENCIKTEIKNSSSLGRAIEKVCRWWNDTDKVEKALAKKYENNINGGMKIVSGLVELGTFVSDLHNKHKFDEEVQRLDKYLVQCRDSIMDDFNREDFNNDYFPNYVVLVENYADSDKRLTEIDAEMEKIHQWKVELEELTKKYVTA